MSLHRAGLALLFLAGFTLSCLSPDTASAQAPNGQRSITDRSIQWPSADQWQRVLLLRDYNTRVVVLGTSMLGLAAGLVGSFTLLRKRALMGDALSHATLPGIALAFVLVTVAGGDGKSLAVLLAGATVSGVLGVGAILFIRNATRLKEDAALGIVLSVFFGVGMAILGVAQRMQAGHAAGLTAFIYGKTASMVATDAWLIAGAALFSASVCLAFFKEFKLLCFDETFAGSKGMPVLTLDIVLMTQVVIVTIIGLQAVGLILMIALLVVPAAAARFWTERMAMLALVSAILGAISSMIGSSMSALFPKLPSGAMIVVVSTFFFLISMILGPARGVLSRLLRRYRLEAKVHQQHFLRAVYERLETQSGELNKGQSLALVELLPMRSWSESLLKRQYEKALTKGWIVPAEPGHFRLTSVGWKEASRVVRQHRLWEIYLITYADVAASQVDRDADAIEHVLSSEMVAELETLLEEKQQRTMVRSPHPVDYPSGVTSG